MSAADGSDGHAPDVDAAGGDISIELTNEQIEAAKRNFRAQFTTLGESERFPKKLEIKQWNSRGQFAKSLSESIQKQILDRGIELREQQGYGPRQHINVTIKRQEDALQDGKISATICVSAPPPRAQKAPVNREPLSLAYTTEFATLIRDIAVEPQISDATRQVLHNQAVATVTANTWQSEERLRDVRSLLDNLRDQPASKKAKKSDDDDGKTKSSAFQVFSREQRQPGGIAHNTPVHAAAPLLSSAWKSLTEEQRQAYHSQYIREYAHHLSSPLNLG
jgi:hypothetical protein